jgi:heme-binding uptake protein ChaN (Tiki superfamily)
MSFRSFLAKNVVLRIVAGMTVAGAAMVSVILTNASFIRTQSSQSTAPPKFRLPDESAGVDEIARTLISVFDQADIVALGEAHQRKLDSDLRIALVRHPDFPKKVRSIVVEFASTTEQPTLDRYILGESVSRAQLEQVWKTTTQAANGVWDDQIYLDFFAAVRDVNSKLPARARIRVFGGDPGPGDNRSRETAAVAVLKEHVLQKHGKALVIYGAAHFYRAAPKDYLSNMGQDIGIVRMLEKDYPGRTFAVIPVGYRWALPPGVFDPDYRKFDRALKTHVRPVLVPLQRLPFQDFAAEEFSGPLLNCRGPGGCVNVFKGSTLTLGQMADAVVYVGADVDTKAKPAR